MQNGCKLGSSRARRRMSGLLRPERLHRRRMSGLLRPQRLQAKIADPPAQKASNETTRRDRRRRRPQRDVSQETPGLQNLADQIIRSHNLSRRRLLGFMNFWHRAEI